MRSRKQILENLESLYRGAFDRTRDRLEGSPEQRPALESLDFEFQQEQLRLEVMLDVRDFLERLPTTAPQAQEGSAASSLLEKAEVIRRLTRLR